MKVSECMTREVRVASADQRICDAAMMMADCDAGSIPVTDGDRLVGMITDRDIAIRAVARGKAPDTRIREVMSPEVLYCYADQDTEEVLDNMGDQQIRRLPVVDRDKRLVGIVSLGDVANGDGRGGEALARISQQTGQHSQTI